MAIFLAVSFRPLRVRPQDLSLPSSFDNSRFLRSGQVSVFLPIRGVESSTESLLTSRSAAAPSPLGTLPEIRGEPLKERAHTTR